VIGITGTNGKTTTKELVTTVLSAKFRTHATAGNFNNHIGVPLTLLSMPEDTEIAVVEMGANHPGEIGDLCRIAEPNYGIITNIGKAHLEGFGSLQGVINTKRELYDHVAKTKGKIFVDASNGLLMELSEKVDRITYGTSNDADYKAGLLSSEPFLTVELDDNIVRTNLLGIYNLTNLAAAWATGRYFGVEAAVAAKALSAYTPANKRSQFMETSANKIYLDAYNANPTSMENALNSFARISLPHKVAILGDMLELGDDSFEEHRKLMEKVKTYDFEKTIFVGPEFCKANDGGFECFENTDDAAAFLGNRKLTGNFILLKGSRGIGLEKLLPVL
jgi:UDP-N-acetylmuramoyl-tripeptide--D-alanyl-D-alanine ligase